MVMLGDSIPEILSTKPLRLNDWQRSDQFMEFNLFLRIHLDMCSNGHGEFNVNMRQPITTILKEISYAW